MVPSHERGFRSRSLAMSLSACQESSRAFISTGRLDSGTVALCFWLLVLRAGRCRVGNLTPLECLVEVVELRKNEFAVAVVLGACGLRLLVCDCICSSAASKWAAASNIPARRDRSLGVAVQRS
jgi:hypothetical protein